MNDRLFYMTEPVAKTDDKTRVFAIGKFDGLHIAHQAVINRAIKVGFATDSIPCLFSFTPHPRFVLTGDPAYERWLTPPQARNTSIFELGIQEVYLANFDEDFRSQTAEEFLRNYILPLGARHLVVGYNFHFGKNGGTDATELVTIARSYGLDVDIVEIVDNHGYPVSSSRIRTHLECGEVTIAAKLLGHPYQIRGKVIHGEALGRKLGFPTANLALSELYVLPKVGVYVVNVKVAGVHYRGMMNLGYRPTVEDHSHLALEVHLLDYSGELYGQELAVEFLALIRDEQKFASLSLLQEQLSKDREFARQWPSA